MTPAQAEVARQMEVCNACRFCEGVCAVFPAMELRRVFAGGDVDYLANLCHGCSACYYDCQYAPPHEFDINVPVAMAALREDSYARYAWPAAAGRILERNGVWLAIGCALCIAVFICGFVVSANPGALFASGSEPGAFYRVMPHNAMVIAFGAVFIAAIAATMMGALRYWRSLPSAPGLKLVALRRAARDAATLRYLDGGGMGCMNDNERPSERRRVYHHLTLYGFLLCFASTASGTVAHYLFDWQAPYPWWSPTVLLGTIGGIGLVIGPYGLLRADARRDPAIANADKTGMGAALLWTLLLLGASGLALLVLRATPAMGLLLAVHLGFVFAFFAFAPYSKFVHGLYRYLALVRYALERQGQGHA